MEREKMIDRVCEKMCAVYYDDDGTCSLDGVLCNDDKQCVRRQNAKELIDEIFPEGSVVLTREEQIIQAEKRSQMVGEIVREAKAQVRKEAVKEFAKNFENYLCDVNNDYCTDDTVPEALYTSAEIDKVMDRTLKDFGVEVEE